MGFRLPFGDDEIPKYDIVWAIIIALVVAALVAWAVGLF
jgi:hypothetical protein